MGSVVKDAEVFYADYDEVQNEVQWSGTVKKEARVGVANRYYNKGLDNETKVTALEAKASVSDEDKLVAGRAEIKTLEVVDHNNDKEFKFGALNAGLEGAVGKNTGAFARADVLSVGMKEENFGVRVGLGLDTGARVGKDGVEAKLLGTGFAVDRQKGVEFSIFGNGINFKFW